MWKEKEKRANSLSSESPAAPASPDVGGGGPCVLFAKRKFRNRSPGIACSGTHNKGRVCRAEFFLCPPQDGPAFPPHPCCFRKQVPLETSVGSHPSGEYLGDIAVSSAAVHLRVTRIIPSRLLWQGGISPSMATPPCQCLGHFARPVDEHADPSTSQGDSHSRIAPRARGKVLEFQVAPVWAYADFGQKRYG